MSIVDGGKPLPEDGEIPKGDRIGITSKCRFQINSIHRSSLLLKGDMTAINIQITCLCELRTSIKRLSTLCST